MCLFLIFASLNEKWALSFIKNTHIVLNKNRHQPAWASASEWKFILFNKMFVYIASVVRVLRWDGGGKGILSQNENSSCLFGASSFWHHNTPQTEHRARALHTTYSQRCNVRQKSKYIGHNDVIQFDPISLIRARRQRWRWEPFANFSRNRNWNFPPN